jgi:DhnA family fructose-bisphosphate aldolase class Ia
MKPSARLNRLLAADGKCFAVAVDHGFFNEGALLGGIEDMRRAIRAIAEAGPDAILLSLGMAPILQSVVGRQKPALILRVDVANVYTTPLPTGLFDTLMDHAVEQALRLDAACVIANLLLPAGQPDIHRQCVGNISRLKADCDRHAMPLMVEPLVMKSGSQGGYAIDGDLEKMLPLVRQAAELGADLIKADPAEDIEQYHRLIEIAGEAVVLVRGGGKSTEEEIFRRTYALMRQGARGLVYGRNIIQHPHPAGMTRAFMALVHEDATPEAALALLSA